MTNLNPGHHSSENERTADKRPDIERIVQRSEFAIALHEVVNDKIDAAHVWELRYAEQTLVLLAEDGQVVASLSDPRLIADVEFPSFVSSRQFFLIPFATGPRSFVGPPSELRALRRRFELELFAAQPELIRSRQRRAVTELLLGFVMALIGCGSITFAFMQDGFAVLLYGLAAVGVAWVIKAIADLWSLRSIHSRLHHLVQFGEVAAQPGSQSLLEPGQAAQVARDRQSSSQLAARLLAGASLIAFASVIAAGYAMVKHESAGRPISRTPVAPPPVASVKPLDLGFPLTKALADIQFLSESDRTLEVSFRDILAFGGLWDAESPTLEINSQTTTGKPIDHTPYLKWLGTNPSERVPTRISAKFRLPSLEDLRHRETPFVATIVVLKPIRRGADGVEVSEESLTTEGVICVVGDDELPRIRTHREELKKWAEYLQRVEGYNATVPRFNDEVTQINDQNERRTTDRRLWLFDALAMIITTTGVSIAYARIGRTFFHFLCLAAVVWMAWIEFHAARLKLEPVQKIELPAPAITRA